LEAEKSFIGKLSTHMPKNIFYTGAVGKQSEAQFTGWR
jgi:hypothetical protein